jgi:hypothetical protein
MRRNLWVLGAGALVLVSAVVCRRPSSPPASTPDASLDAPHSSEKDPGERPRNASVPDTRGLASTHAAQPDDDAALADFGTWLRRDGADPRKGVELARARREALKRLIMTDPERALKEAVSYADRKRLPAEVVALLEERVSGRGTLLQALSTDESGENPVQKSYAVEFPRRAYDAYVYGRRVDQSINRAIPLHGIAVDEALAVHEQPARLLEREELADFRKTRPPAEDVVCPLSGLPAVQAGADVGGQLVPLCEGGHIEGLNARLAADEGTGVVMAAASPWVTGPKKLLYIRVDFSDLPGEPVTQAVAQSTMDGAVSSFFVTTSFSQTSIGPTTVTPVLRLPKTAATYRSSSTTLLSDARATARAAVS